MSAPTFRGYPISENSTLGENEVLFVDGNQGDSKIWFPDQGDAHEFICRQLDSRTHHPPERIVVGAGVRRALNSTSGSWAPDLPARYHAALDEVEAKKKATERAIRDLLRELEQATGAEVKGADLSRRWPTGLPSYLETVTLRLEALPQGRRVWGKEGGS